MPLQSPAECFMICRDPAPSPSFPKPTPSAQQSTLEPEKKTKTTCKKKSPTKKGSEWNHLWLKPIKVEAKKAADQGIILSVKKQVASFAPQQGPTSTLYSNRTRIFLSYSNPTRKFLKNDRVASSVYYSHFRKIAARPASQYYSPMDTALVEIFSFISSLSSAINLVFYIIFNFRNKQN